MLIFTQSFVKSFEISTIPPSTAPGQVTGAQFLVSGFSVFRNPSLKLCFEVNCNVTQATKIIPNLQVNFVAATRKNHEL